MVNGRAKTAPDGATVATLLVALDLDARTVAVEVNEQLVRRAQHAAHALASGDRVEIVTFVGGG